MLYENLGSIPPFIPLTDALRQFNISTLRIEGTRFRHGECPHEFDYVHSPYIYQTQHCSFAVIGRICADVITILTNEFKTRTQSFWLTIKVFASYPVVHSRLTF